MKKTGLILLFVLFSSCATFHHIPLTQKKVSAALFSPDLTKITKLKKGLSPKEIASLAISYNRKLKIERDKNSIEQAVLIESGMFSNPEISFDIQHPSGGNTKGTINAYDIGASWSSDKLFTHGLYENISKLKLSKLNLELAWKEWQVAEQAKQFTYALIFIRKKIKKNKLLVNNINAFMKDIQKNVSLGLLPESSYFDLQQKSLSLKKTLYKLKNEYFNNEIKLKKLINFPYNKKLILSDNMPNFGKIAIRDYKTLDKNIAENRIDVIALKKAYESNETALKAAIMEQFPAIVISFTQSRDNGNLYTIAPGVSISLPIFNHNQSKIAELRANRRKLFDEYVYRIYSARINIFKIYKLIERRKKLIELTKQYILNLKNKIKNYEHILKMGEGSIVSFNHLKNMAIEEDIRLIDEQWAFTKLLTALEIETGKNLSSLIESKKSVKSHARSIK